jgi:predicted ATPase
MPKYYGLRNKLKTELNIDASSSAEEKQELSDFQKELIECTEIPCDSALAKVGKLAEHLIYRIMIKEQLQPSKKYRENLESLRVWKALTEKKHEYLDKAWRNRLHNENASCSHPYQIISNEIADKFDYIAGERNSALHPFDVNTSEDRSKKLETDVDSVINAFLGILQWYYRRYHNVNELIVSPPLILPKNLRILPNSIQRLEQINYLKHLLKSARLVTIVGPGGIGKTELAQQVAVSLFEEYYHEVAFIPLEYIDSSVLNDHPEYLEDVLATELKIKEENHRLKAIIDFFNSKGRFLLVFDNCEHLGANFHRLVRKLFESCPYLYILNTSRRPLNMNIEQQIEAPPLTFPKSEELLLPPDQLYLLLQNYESAKLFSLRAKLINPNFVITLENCQDVARICNVLEGIPLAIELAAAKIKAFPTLKELTNGLTNVISVLKSSDPDISKHKRSHTIEATLKWSYDLLPTDKQKMLLAELSVFRGFTKDSVQTVCYDKGISKSEIPNLLNSLIDNSLVTRVSDHRYRLLEVIRQFSYEKLKQSRRLKTLQRRHLFYYSKLAESAGDIVMKDVETLRALQEERGNLIAALDFAMETKAHLWTAARIAGALAWFWCLSGYLAEAQIYLDKISDKLLLNRDRKVGILGRLPFGIFRSIGRRTLVPTANVQYGQGLIAWHQGDLEKAREYFKDCWRRYREAKYQPGEANALNYLGNIANDKGKYKVGRCYHGKSLEIRKILGNTDDIAASLHNLGEGFLLEGSLEEAQSHLMQAVEFLQAEGANQRWKANCHELLGRIALEKDDDVKAAEEHLRLCLKLRDEQLSDRTFVPYSLECYAFLAQRLDHSEHAAKLLGAAEVLRETARHPLPESYQTQYQKLIENLQDKLGEQPLRDAWKVGRGWRYEQAVRHAFDTAQFLPESD